MTTASALRFALNLLLALTLAAGPALAMPSAQAQAAAAADAMDPPCHGAPLPPTDEACDSGCCADASCDPGACRMAPALMVAVSAPLFMAGPVRLQPAPTAVPDAAAQLGVALRPPIA